MFYGGKIKLPPAMQGLPEQSVKSKQCGLIVDSYIHDVNTNLKKYLADNRIFHPKSRLILLTSLVTGKIHPVSLILISQG